MAVEWNALTFQLAYSKGYDQVWVSAFKDKGWGYFGAFLTNLLSRSQYSASTETLFVGCGFGYWIEALATVPGVNMNNIWGIDNSTFIQENVNNSAKVNLSISEKILNLDITSPSILNDLKEYFGGNGKVNGWVISCLVIDSMQTDTEINSFLNACNNLKSNSGDIAHIIVSQIADVNLRYRQQTAVDIGLNMKSREEWAAYAPDHYWFDFQANDSPDGSSYAFYAPGVGWSWQ